MQAAFLLPVLTGMMKNGLSGSAFSDNQEPQALVIAPTRELASQIFLEARKFSHGSMLRPVVCYGGTSVGHQLRQLEQGAHIVIGTPGRLVDFISKGKVSIQLEYYKDIIVLLWRISAGNLWMVVGFHPGSPQFPFTSMLGKKV